MPNNYFIQEASLINEGEVFDAHVSIVDGLIHKIDRSLTLKPSAGQETISAKGLWLMPGMIDDQVHFREPGLTHKADLESESRAAVAGGITSFMEMPNTVPNTLTQELLVDKYRRASEVSSANYSFYMGGSNDNIKEVLKTDPKTVCGVKVFMGSSTGNMLVDNRETLEGLFSECPMLIATHCEDEGTIRANMAAAKAQYGEDVPIGQHPIIRSAEACYKSSSMAVELATKHNTRLHILHISTAQEVGLFGNNTPRKEKRITAEACVHHLWFSDEDYAKKGTHIKWNPAVKTAHDRAAVRKALNDGVIDVLATDHAPHTLEEKTNSYFQAPSGGPLVQHALQAAIELSAVGVFTLPTIVDRFSHAVADLFQIDRRGYIREGYHADLVLVDPETPYTVSKSNILYKCGWSPFDGNTFRSSVHTTLVNGEIVFSDGKVNKNVRGARLAFDR